MEVLAILVEILATQFFPFALAPRRITCHKQITAIFQPKNATGIEASLSPPGAKTTSS
jgi:hypothetical protein